jgi:hypothetical protein
MCCNGHADYGCRRAYGPRRAQDQQARASSSAKQVDLAHRSTCLTPKPQSGSRGVYPSSYWTTVKPPLPAKSRSFGISGSRRLEYLTAVHLLYCSVKFPHVRQITFVCAYVVPVAYTTSHCFIHCIIVLNSVHAEGLYPVYRLPAIRQWFLQSHLTNEMLQRSREGLTTMQPNADC